MAQTTTAINACSAVLQIDNAGGTPVDVSGSSNTASLSFSFDTATGVTFEGDWNFRLQCKKDGSLELSVMWTTAVGEAEGRHLLETWFAASSPGARTVSVFPNGTSTGEREYTGEFVITELSVPLTAGEAGPIVMTATLEPDGAITFGTAA